MSRYLAVIKHHLLPPNEWQLSRIINLHLASGQNISVVDIRIQSGTVTRNVTKLCVLPPIQHTRSST